MAFNGSGTYNLPAADLPVSGQLVSSTKMNSILSDLATALSLCLARDGQSTMSGTLKMGAQKITGVGDGAVGAPAIAFSASTTTGVYSPASNTIALAAAGVKRIAADTYATVTHDVGGEQKIGYLGIPLSSTTTTLALADRGQCVGITADIAVPNSTFAAGDSVSIYNNSAAAKTITATITTLRFAGTTLTGNRTLAARGMATIWFLSGTEAIITGAGLS